MANINVSFLDKDFTIPEQLPVYISEMQESSKYSDQLMGILLSQMRAGDWAGGAEEDFAVWREPVNVIAKDLIRKASDVGVFDLTINILVDSNPAFIELHNICSKCMDGMRLVLMEQISGWMQDYDNAYNDAARNITGPGFGILTNSFASVLLYEAVSYSAYKQQARQADRDFQAAMTQINAREQAQRDKKNAEIISNYYNSVKNIIPSIIAIMMEKYFEHINSAGAFNYAELNNYDMKASDSILNNLDVVDNKKEVLYKAFEKCPYNSNIYLKTTEFGLMNSATYSTAQILHQSDCILEALELNCKNSFNRRDESFINNVIVLADITHESELEIKQRICSNDVDTVIRAYEAISDALKDDSSFRRWVSSTITSDGNVLLGYSCEELTRIVRNKVESIISANDFTYLVTVGALCNNERLLDSVDLGYSDFNNVYVERIISNMGLLKTVLQTNKSSYEDICNKFRDEEKMLLEKKNSLLAERGNLSIFNRSAKKSIDQEVLNLNSRLEQLERSIKENDPSTALII